MKPLLLCCWLLLLASRAVRCAAPVPRVLIHVPAHHQTTDREIRGFLRACFQHRPFLESAPVTPQFDVLLVLSGNASRFQAARLAGILQGTLRPLNVSAVHVELLSLANDKSDRSRASADWTGGPNAAFYAVMHERGDIFARVTRRYDYVLQMETDVLTLAHGWLGTVLQPALEGAEFLISGASIAGARCVFDERERKCNPLAAEPDFVQRHINGNALYNVKSAQLQQLFNHSLEKYALWPFDLASWLSARDRYWLHLLRHAPSMVSVPHPISTTVVGHQVRVDLAAGVAFAHVPTRMRVPPLDAALCMLDTAKPVTLTFVSASHLSYFSNLLASLVAQAVENVLVVAFDQATFDAVRALAPARYQVLKNISSSSGSTAFKSAAFLELVNSRQAVINDILRRKYALFCVDVDVFVMRDYTQHLMSLPGDRMYFSSDAIGAHGYHHFNESEPRYFFNAGVFFVPQNATKAAVRLMTDLIKQIAQTGRADQDLLNELIVCTRLEECRYTHGKLRVGLLDPALFHNGGNYFARQWPSPAALGHALLVHNNWADGFDAKRFRFQSAGMWPSTPTACANVTVLSASPLHLGGTLHAADSLLPFLSFFQHVREHAFDCAVVPGFNVSGTGILLPFDAVFDHHRVRNATAATLFPDLKWLRSSSPAHFWSADASARLPEDLLLGPMLTSTFNWEHNAIGWPRTCVDDLARSAEQVAVLSLRGLQSVVSAATELGGKPGEKVFLAGAWRIMHAQLDAASSALYTSASRRVFPPHERTSFGLFFVNARLGDDVMFDLLDLMLCRQSDRTVQLSAAAFPAWDVPQLLAEVARHIPAAILEEDLHVLSNRSSTARDMQLSSRVLFSLEDLSTNGFSNRMGTMQTLAYVSSLVNASCIMPPYQPVHNKATCAPWKAVLHMSHFYEVHAHALPPSVAVLLMPRAIFAMLLDGAQLPLETPPLEAAEGLLRFPDAVASLVRHCRAGRPYSTLYVGQNAESARLRGRHAVRPAHAYLGLTDAEVFDSARTVPYDIGLPTTFRAYKFEKAAPQHLQFAQRWRASFVPSDGVQRRTNDTIAAMQQPFACVHLRVLDEFLRDHRAQEHGNRTHALSMFRRFVDAQLALNVSTFYLATDTDIRALLEAPPADARFHTCFDFGCNARFGDDTRQGFIDGEVCKAAHVFRGNVYSSYTLAVCARRNDQLCEDLFGRRITDERLLM